MFGLLALIGCGVMGSMGQDLPVESSITVFGRTAIVQHRSDSDGAPDDVERSSVVRFDARQWRAIEEAVRAEVGEGPGALVFAGFLTSDAAPDFQLARSNTAGIVTIWHDPARLEAIGASSGLFALPGAPAVVADLPGKSFDVTPLEVRIYGRTPSGFVELLRDESTGDPGWLVYEAAFDSLLPNQAHWLYGLASDAFPDVMGPGQAWDRDLADALYTNADVFPNDVGSLVRREPDVLAPAAE